MVIWIRNILFCYRVHIYICLMQRIYGSCLSTYQLQQLLGSYWGRRSDWLGCLPPGSHLDGVVCGLLKPTSPNRPGSPHESAALVSFLRWPPPPVCHLALEKKQTKTVKSTKHMAGKELGNISFKWINQTFFFKTYASNQFIWSKTKPWHACEPHNPKTEHNWLQFFHKSESLLFNPNMDMFTKRNKPTCEVKLAFVNGLKCQYSL